MTIQRKKSTANELTSSTVLIFTQNINLAELHKGNLSLRPIRKLY